MQFSLNALRFEDVRQNVINYLKENGRYTAEFDFQGSNLAYIIDSMAYTNMLMSYQLSMMANNIFLDTTEIRKNAVSIGKTLGYKPSRKKAAQISGVIRYNKGANDTASWNENTSIVIPPKTIFTGQNVGLPFVNLDSITLSYRNPLMLEGEFTLYQGTFKSFEVFGDDTSLQSITIPSQDVEDNNLTVSIKPTIGDQVAIAWQHVKTFFGISDQKIYFVEEDIINEGYPRILFGNGIVGRIPSLTETIIVSYLETKGIEGNDENEFEFPESVVNATHSIDISQLALAQFEFVIPTNSFTFGGSDLESLESIKVNAPRYFSAAGRAVTGNDFRTILTDFPSLHSFDVIGGAELYSGDDTQLGKSYITAVPVFDNFFQSEKVYLSEVEEVEILGSIRDLGIISTRKIFFRPSYVIIDVDPSVEIDVDATIEERRSISNAVAANIEDYIITYLNKLGPKYRESKLSSSMNVTPGVISSDVNVSYSLGINHDTFYTNKVTTLFFPSLKQKDLGGNTIYDEYDQPQRISFVKSNSTLLEKYNAENSTSWLIDQWPLTNLEANASVHGALSHPGRERIIFSKDIDQTTIIELYDTIKADGTYVPSDNLWYSKFSFVSQDGVTYTPGLINNGDSTWNIMLDTYVIGVLSINANNWEVTSVNTEVLESMGVVDMSEITKIFITHEIDENNWNYPSSDSTVTTKISIKTSGNASSLQLRGKSRIFDFEWVEPDPLGAPGDFEYLITELQTINGIEFEASIDAPNNKAIISYDGTDVLEIVRNPVFNTNTVTFIDDLVLNDINMRADSYSILSHDVLDESGMVIGTTEAVYLVDIFNESKISTMKYDTGETTFLKNIVGTVKEETSSFDINLSITRSIPIKTVFDEYTENNLMDFLSFQQDDILDSNGNPVDLVTDFDARFCQFVILNVSSPTLKRV